MTFEVLGPVAARAAAGLPSIAGDVGMGDERQARFFLDALFRGDGWIEVRALSRIGEPPRQVFFPVRNADLCATECGVLAANWDVYVGVAPRAREAGGRDALRGDCSWCWAECDTPMSVSRAFDMHIPPHMVVRSSPGRAHCYWPLRTPLSLDLLERANKRLAEHLGADPRATDAARILRVPGTVNHKYDPPPRVSITHVELFTRNPLPSELVGGLADPAPARPLPVRTPRRDFGPDADKERLAAIPSREYIYALSGREVLRNMATCPFHSGGSERTPSLHVGGPALELWHCFGCDEGGDIFSFAAKLWGLDSHRDFAEVKRRVGEAVR